MGTTGLTVILFISLFAILLSGIPLGFGLAGVAVIFILWQLGPAGLHLIAITAFTDWTNFTLIAIPLFVLMANFLDSSGIAEDLYEMIYQWIGSIKGGLAMGTILICTIFAAMAGLSGVATVTMGLIALPSMLKRHYDKSLALGSISAGGTLGILIPPSIIMIMYGGLTEESVGKLFLGGIIPGILITFIFIGYIAIRCLFQPELGPSVPKEERLSWEAKLRSLNALLMPCILIIVVLGAIYTGACTPTEASGVGAFGAFLCVLIRRRFTWNNFINVLQKTLRFTAMIMWIVMGAKLFSHVYYAIGAPELVGSVIGGLEVNRWVIVILMQFIVIALGMFLDPLGIMVICTPIFVPIIIELGFSTLWFGILFTINMEIGYITPPFGFNLFYMKGVVPKHIKMVDIYKSVFPFALLMMLGMGIVMAFPQLALWLPASAAG